jgi:hypothetical protein
MPSLGAKAPQHAAAQQRAQCARPLAAAGALERGYKTPCKCRRGFDVEGLRLLSRVGTSWHGSWQLAARAEPLSTTAVVLVVSYVKRRRRERHHCRGAQAAGVALGSVVVVGSLPRARRDGTHGVPDACKLHDRDARRHRDYRQARSHRASACFCFCQGQARAGLRRAAPLPSPPLPVLSDGALGAASRAAQFSVRAIVSSLTERCGQQRRARRRASTTPTRPDLLFTSAPVLLPLLQHVNSVLRSTDPERSPVSGGVLCPCARHRPHRVEVPLRSMQMSWWRGALIAAAARPLA